MNTEGKTVGEILRGAREARKLSVEQVNRETKISVQTVNALESDDFGAFPSETYLKGFVRTYAEFLGLDGNRLWAMIGSRTATPASGAGLSWDTEAGLHEERLGPPPWIRRVVLPVLIVIIIVLAILLVRERQKAPASVGWNAAAELDATVASR
ncbi:MAG TPA: helix-turn-helix transcriptional regulator [Candidatus Krumholzibacteria bacterium]|nr:helix-turn-helix transcriptional regulator [Candidatus Krumholzibacteria bacterium]